MILTLHRRAEIALRSMSEVDRERVSSALERLRTIPPNGMLRVPEIRRLSSRGLLPLHTYDAGDAMRIVFSVGSQGITVEDIAPTSRLENVA